MTSGGAIRTVDSPHSSTSRPLVSAGHRITAVGRAVRARTPALHEVAAGDHRPDRHARGDALGGEEDIGQYAPMLGGPHPAGSTGAGLNFVGDEDDAVAIADLAQAL